MPDQKVIEEMLVLSDPNGSQIRLCQCSRSAWSKELLIMSRGPSGGNWSSYIYITGPIEKHEIADWIKQRTAGLADGSIHSQNIFTDRQRAFSRKKHLKELMITKNSADKICFSWEATDMEPETLYELAYFIENWEPVF